MSETVIALVVGFVLGAMGGFSSAGLLRRRWSGAQRRWSSRPSRPQRLIPSALPAGCDRGPEDDMLQRLPLWLSWPGPPAVAEGRCSSFGQLQVTAASPSKATARSRVNGHRKLRFGRVGCNPRIEPLTSDNAVKRATAHPFRFPRRVSSQLARIGTTGLRPSGPPSWWAATVGRWWLRSVRSQRARCEPGRGYRVGRPRYTERTEPAADVGRCRSGGAAVLGAGTRAGSIACRSSGSPVLIEWPRSQAQTATAASTMSLAPVCTACPGR